MYSATRSPDTSAASRESGYATNPPISASKKVLSSQTSKYSGRPSSLARGWSTPRSVPRNPRQRTDRRPAAVAVVRNGSSPSKARTSGSTDSPPPASSNAPISALPGLQPYTLRIGLATLAMITLVNLRGVREAGVAFLLPTYLFVGSLLAVLGLGVARSIMAGGHPSPVVAPHPQPAAEVAATTWLLLRAFASGCTAMTGVEAVSNGVGAFREPTVPNARRTLSAIIAILAAMLAGIAYLCHAYNVGATEPGRPGYESVLSQLVGAVVGRGWAYYVTIGSTLAVLALSANTGFADFPRLCRAVAQDGYLPSGFAHRGRRLVYSQGILVLAVLSAILLVAFGGITDNLIPLFAVGAFLAFTLSQAGMVVHWRRDGGPHWRKAAAINAAGAACTAVTLVVVLVSKFAEGAWVTALIVPLLVALFAGVHTHYRAVGREVATDAPMDAAGLQPPLALVPIRGWSAITRKALRLALKVSPEVYALHVAADEDAMQALEDGWERRVLEPARAAGLSPPQLVVVYSPYRRLYGPLKQVVSDLQKAHPGRDIAVVVPELVGTRWYHYALHNQTAALIKAYLLLSGFRRVVVVNVPWYLEE